MPPKKKSEKQVQQDVQEDENVINIMDVMSQTKADKTKQILKDYDIEIPNAQDMLRAALSGGYAADKLNIYFTTVSQLNTKKDNQGGFLEQKDLTKLNNNKQLLKFQTQVKDFLDFLSKNSLTVDEVAEVLLPFADPTFDTTFKELFGSDKHENILISLLNSLLGFKGSETITSVDIIPGNLEAGNVSYKKGESGLKSEVDVLCTTQEGKTIAIEMQRAKQPYFLARMEYYMSKLIAGQLTEKDTNIHHKAIDKTYILVLAKENLFTGQHQLIDRFDKGTQTTEDQQDIVDSFIITSADYEIDAAPKIVQTGQIFPDNKMYWKFFELSKFKEHNDSKNLTKDSDLKYQWLEFIIDCGSQLNEPDRHKLIKEGYNIMKALQRDNLLKAKYWNEYHAQFEHELDIESQKQHAKLEGIKEGELKGKLKTLLGMDIKKIQKHFKSKDEESELKEDFSLLNKKRYLKQIDKDYKLIQNKDKSEKEQVEEKFKFIIDHIKNHSDHKYDQICDQLKLIGDDMDLDNVSECSDWSHI